MVPKEYHIPFTGLKAGQHQFSYKVNNEFFEHFGYRDFNHTNLSINAIFTKNPTIMELDLSSKGTVNVNCDVTGEPFDMEVSGDLHLVIKFGDEYEEVDEELLIIPHGEIVIDASQFIYEMIVLSVPQKRTHPGVEDGTLQSDILDKLVSLQPKEEKIEENETDPRWDKLKDLLTDK